MELQSKQQRRKDRFIYIRTSLANMPIISQTSKQLSQKMQKNRLRRGSDTFGGRQLVVSRQIELDQSQSQKFTSLFHDRYVVGEKIGQGAHGIVKKCHEKNSTITYAVKTMTLDREHILFLKRNFIDIKQLKHENIIGYQALYFQLKNQTCHLVMDYLPFPDLLHIHIKSQQFLKSIVYQVLESITYIHRNKICHRDIKPQNILYDQLESKVKLIDFGISKKLIYRGRKKEMLTITGTLYYRAPEMFQGGGYDEMVDLWALGITIYKLMVGSTPFQSQYHNQTIANIMKGQITFPPQICQIYSKISRDLVVRLLKKRNQRLTAGQALHHLWFMNIHKNDQIMRSVTYNKQINFEFPNPSLQVQGEFSKSNTRTKQLQPKQIFEKLKGYKTCFELQNVQEQNMIYGCQQPISKSTVSFTELDQFSHN